MTLAIDYEAAYIRDPRFWDMVIALAQSRGHKVACVSGRTDASRELARLALHLDAVILAGETPKREALAGAGTEPDVWVGE